MTRAVDRYLAGLLVLLLLAALAGDVPGLWTVGDGLGIALGLAVAAIVTAAGRS